MSETGFLSIYLMFIMSIILILQIGMPNFTRKDLVFGIRVPLEEINCEKIKSIRKKFIRNNLIIGIPFIALCTFINYKLSSIGFFTFSVFVFIFITFGIYLFSNKEMKRLKINKGWMKGKKQIVAVDTSFSKNRNKKMLVSPWYFLIPLAIVGLNIIIGYKFYPSLPERVATHWNFAGEVDGYQNRSMSLIWQLPLMQLFMTIIMFVSYKAIGWSKQQISVANPEEGRERNRIYRKVWSIYMVAMAIGTNLLMSMGTLETFKVINHKGYIPLIMIFVFGILCVGSAIILAVKVGQGGSNLKLNMDEKESTSSSERDDDMYWKLGNSIYYNPNDPSIFIEKRFGVGWTINAGSPIGMIIYIALFIVTVVAIVSSIFFK